MNKEEIENLIETIRDKLDFIQMNVARINGKDYIGLDIELLKYIRLLELQLETSNKKIEDKEVKE